jgi:hypothetical protein
LAGVRGGEILLTTRTVSVTRDLACEAGFATDFAATVFFGFSCTFVFFVFTAMYALNSSRSFGIKNL